jgi:ribosomal protein S18 acetylase RimI-like enzyme
MAPLVVRRATARDIDGIVECLRTAFEPYRDQYTPGAFADTVPGAPAVRRRLADMNLFVAVGADGRIVGTIAYRLMSSEEGHVRGMAVRPDHQGRAVAQQLLDTVEGELRERRCSRITLDTTQPLARAIAFYSRNGFAPSGRVSDFYGMPLFEYVKTLA